MEATASALEIEKLSLMKGDVVITKDSETPDDIAVPALVREDLEQVVCGYHLAIIRPKPGVADGGFLAALFLLPRVRHYFYSLANGATRFGLSVGAISEARFSIPPLAEQQKIAKKIMVLDDEVRNLVEQRKTLVIQKHALMQKLLTGKRRVKL